MKLFTLLEFCLYVSKINVLGSLQKFILNSKHSFLLLLSKIKYHYQSFYLVLCHCVCVAPIIKTKIDIKIKCNKMKTLLSNCIYDLQFRKRLFTMCHALDFIICENIFSFENPSLIYWLLGFGRHFLLLCNIILLISVCLKCEVPESNACW